MGSKEEEYALKGEEIGFSVFDVPEGERTLTTSEYLIKRANHFAQIGRTACITNGLTGQSIRYSEIERIVKIYTWKLLNLGFKPGETVIYNSGDPLRLHLFLIAIWEAQGIIRASYAEDIGELLIERLVESKSRWLLCDQKYIPEMRKTLEASDLNVKILILGLNGVDSIELNKNCIFLDSSDPELNNNEIIQNQYAASPNTKVGLDDIALILPTSGTSNKSKGVVYTHRNLLANIRVHEKIAFVPDPTSDPILFAGRVTHFTGSVCPLSGISSGKNMILLGENVNKLNLMRTIQDYQIKGIFSFPKYLLDIANDPESKALVSLQHITTGGMIISPSIVEKIRQFPSVSHLLIQYGMTESGLFTTNSDLKASKNGQYKAFPELRHFCCGKILPETSVKVLDVETGRSLKEGEIGELYFKTPLTALGYLNNPEETRSTFLANGYIKTGDLGYFDSDGFVYVVDRAKEIFKYFNNHISPSEIESIILLHKDIEEVCVVGIPDPQGGDHIPRAYVVLKQDTNGITPKEIEEFANSRLESYKHLRGGVFFVKEIPKGKCGKISRNFVKQTIQLN